MSTDDLIRAWKDPDHRGEHPGIDHPAGGIELADSDDAVGATSFPCVSVATFVMSCAPTCDSTVVAGTCGAFSYGCC